MYSLNIIGVLKCIKREKLTINSIDDRVFTKHDLNDILPLAWTCYASENSWKYVLSGAVSNDVGPTGVVPVCIS